jgi:DNA-binding transcriptional ArsR family regulator
MFARQGAPNMKLYWYYRQKTPYFPNFKKKGASMAGADRETTEKLEQAADIFKGFSNPIRIRIITALIENSLRVMDLANELQCSQPIISQQLKILKSAGIVQRTRIDKNYMYELSSSNFAEIIRCMKGCLRS